MTNRTYTQDELNNLIKSGTLVELTQRYNDINDVDIMLTWLTDYAGNFAEDWQITHALPQGNNSTVMIFFKDNDTAMQFKPRFQ